MRTIIIEDEKPAADQLKEILAGIGGIEVVKTFGTVRNAIPYLQAKPEIDLLFMDIQLGDGKSFDILDQAQVTCPIVFVTAFDEYAIKAFQYNSVGYLLKPIRKKDLEAVLAKYRKHRPAPPAYHSLSDLIEQLKSEKKIKSRFLVKKDGRYFSIKLSDVAYAFSKERLNYLKTFGGEEYLIENTLEELEEQLDPESFFRANRQFIVAHRAIGQVTAWFDGKLVVALQPAGYEEIVISRLRANDFKRWMGK